MITKWEYHSGDEAIGFGTVGDRRFGHLAGQKRWGHVIEGNGHRPVGGAMDVGHHQGVVTLAVDTGHL